MADRCCIAGCRDVVQTWCHARCCSGEQGFCHAHWRGSRHEREFYYEQMTGDMLPYDRDALTLEILAQRERLLNMPDEWDKRRADVKLVVDLLEAELKEVEREGAGEAR